MGVKKAANLLWFTPLNSCYLTFLSLQRDSLFYKIVMVFSAMGQNSTSRVTTSREKEKSTAKSKLSKITLFRKIPREGPLLVASGIEPCSMGVGYILCLLANKANTETTQEDTRGGSDICGIWLRALPSECGWQAQSQCPPSISLL